MAMTALSLVWNRDGIRRRGCLVPAALQYYRLFPGDQPRLPTNNPGRWRIFHRASAQSFYPDVMPASNREQQKDISAMNNNIKRLAALSIATAMLGGSALAQQMSAGRADLMTSVPPSSLTVTDWYKQPVYDKSDSKIGDVKDVLVGPNGEISAVILGVGGMLGAGEKDVAVNFSAIKQSNKNDKVYLTMDTTKDALNSAPGFKYDSGTTSWVPDNSSK
jgi:hypothetical protein